MTLGDDRSVVQVIAAEREEWIDPFTGLSVRQFHHLVQTVTELVLLVAAYWRTNLTLQ